MKKGKKKWLIAVIAAAVATLGVVQPELVPVVPVILDALGVSLPVE